MRVLRRNDKKLFVEEKEMLFPLQKCYMRTEKEGDKPSDAERDKAEID